MQAGITYTKGKYFFTAILELGFDVEVAYAIHESPLPPRGGEGGVSRSTAPRRRSRPAMQRGPWEGSGERETVMTFMIGGAWKSHDR
jgi:hypothetical protein